MQSKFWQRPLKDGRMETYVSMDGHVLHLSAAPNVTADVLRMWEQATGLTLPTQVERKAARFGRRQFRGALAGQESLFA